MYWLETLCERLNSGTYPPTLRLYPIEHNPGLYPIDNLKWYDNPFYRAEWL